MKGMLYHWAKLQYIILSTKLDSNQRINSFADYAIRPLWYLCILCVKIDGLEPTTVSLENWCSIHWAKSPLVVDRGIEPLFLGWKPSVLTDRRIDHEKFVAGVGFEPRLKVMSLICYHCTTPAKYKSGLSGNRTQLTAVTRQHPNQWTNRPCTRI